MGSQPKRNPNKQLQLNPNWAQLQQKLNIHNSKPPRPSDNSQNENQKTILGKRKERTNAELDDSQTNPLIPINDDFRLSVTLGFDGERNFSLSTSACENAVAMDCEMVGVGQGNKSALGRVTLVNKWGNVVYDEFVRPVDRVVDFRTEISGIRPRDLRKAKGFQVVQNRVADIIKGKLLVGHALHNDLKVLLLSHPKKDLRDTSEYQTFLKEGGRRSLRHLAAEFLGVQIQNGEHCPIQDARAAMLLYQKNRKEWEKNAKDQIRLKLKQKKRKPRKKAKQGGVMIDHAPAAL